MTAIPPVFFGANPQKKIITFYRVLTDTTDTHVLFFESQADLNQKNFSFSFQDFCTVEVDCVRQHCCAYKNKSI